MTYEEFKKMRGIASKPEAEKGGKSEIPTDQSKTETPPVVDEQTAGSEAPATTETETPPEQETLGQPEAPKGNRKKDVSNP